MSEMTVTVRDSHRAIRGRLHGSTANRVFAALSADPVTIEELVRAMGRYMKCESDSDPFHHFHAGICTEYFDAGVLVIDLSARLVACESTYFAPDRDSSVSYSDGQRGTASEIPFDISPNWLIISQVEAWEVIAEERRLHWAAASNHNSRETLYNEVVPFIVREVLAKTSAFAESPLDEHELLRKKQRSIRTIHADWMMARRDDLGGKSPREVLVANLSHIQQDVENQSIHWSLLREPPPAVNRDSWAYSYSGYGLHEFVVYYELVRLMIYECWDRIQAATNRFSPSVEAEHLGQFKQEWLHAPSEDFSGMSPSQIIDRERARLPWVDSHMAADSCDCPLCQAMADGDFGPSFWFMDCTGMDTDFAFSIYETEEEWELEIGDHHRWCQEQEEFEDTHREVRDSPKGESEIRFDKSERVEFFDAPIPAKGGDLAPRATIRAVETSIWQNSFTAPQMFEPGSDMAIPAMQLFAIGAHIAEVVEDLRGARAQESTIKGLLESFGSVRQAIRDELTWLLESHIASAVEQLLSIRASYPQLAEKCECLRHEFTILSQCAESRGRNGL